MISLRSRACTLRKSGHSLTEICHALSLPKTTAYEYIRSTPLPAHARARLKKEQSERARKTAHLRRGISKRTFLPLPRNADGAMLMGHLLFDGSIGRFGCAYNNRNSVLINRVKILMKRVYAYEPSLYTNTETGVHRISYFNVALGAYLLKTKQPFLSYIASPTASRAEKKSFLKAFFDDEGCADVRLHKRVRQVRGYQKNTHILILIQKLLSELHITSRVVLPNEIVISGKSELEKFEQRIGFSEDVCINQHRSNSLWKKPLQKKDLLRKAIESFV